MANSRFYSSLAVPNTLGATITNASGSLYLGTAPVGYPTQFPFTLVLETGTGNMELVQVNSGAGTSGSPWVVSRGFDGTTAVGHSAGVAVGHDSSAFDFTTSRTHEALITSGSGAHGLPSAAWLTSQLAQIAQTVIAGATGTITFAAIPATYRHLLLVVHGKSSDTTSDHTDVGVQVNGDSTNSYTWCEWSMTTESGSMVTAANYSNGTFWPWVIKIAGSNAAVGVSDAGGGWVLFPGYASTAFAKPYVSQSGFGNSGSGSNLLGVRSGWGWYGPAAVAAISQLVLTASAGNFMTGTVASLYGIGS